MKSLDTNVLARFFVDDPDDEEATRQRPAAIAAMAEPALVTVTVLLELEWVMRGLYGLRREWHHHGCILGTGRSAGAYAASGTGAPALRSSEPGIRPQCDAAAHPRHFRQRSVALTVLSASPAMLP